MPATAAVTTWLRLVFAALALLVAIGLVASWPPWISAALALAGIAAAAAAAEWALGRPADRLARDLGIIARDNPKLALAPPAGWAARLAQAAHAVQARLVVAEGNAEQVLAAATARIDEQKQRLEAILLDLSEGVIVCGPGHQVLLFNQAASALVEQPHALGLGRPVFEVLSREAVLHALDRRTHAAEKAAAAEHFVCATSGGLRLLQARLSLMLDAEAATQGYVLTLSDASTALDRGARLDRLLRAGIERQRGLLASLRAAVETLTSVPDLDAAERGEFERVLLEESVTLSEQNAALARALGEVGPASWPMSEIHTGDLCTLLAARIARAAVPVRIVAAGLPDWIYADSLSLLDLLEHLVATLAREAGVEQVTVAIARTHATVNLDLIWTGARLPPSVLDGWLDVPFEAGRSTGDARAVLERHGTDCWCQAAGADEAMIRIPLPSAQAPAAAGGNARPARPEFYDFDLALQPAVTDALRERSLRELSFVVFDVETTGLRLSQGDEVVSIGAVRVVNGRVLPLEVFERLVNPGRPIPEASVRFHGVTDAMVRDKPPFALVLPQFYRFVGDAVLVAHNAAFDMTALTRAGRGAGVTFDNPVLDTLLISAWLDAEEGGHSLDDIAQRLGIVVTARHDALGDALVTAAILVRQIERLEARGIRRFGELAVATDMSARLRQHQQQF